LRSSAPQQIINCQMHMLGKPSNLRKILGKNILRKIPGRSHRFCD